MNRQLVLLCFFAALALSGLSACNRGRSVEAARDAHSQAVSPAEQDFMMKATQANLVEIDTARSATQKSDNIDVREYANMIQSDHTGALANLADLMKDKNLPQPNTLPTDAKENIARMNGLTGPEFDREFVNLMVADHEKAVEMFRDQSTTTQNPDLKKYVEVVLPKLEMHLDKAQRLQSKLFSGGVRK